ncbi:hypothetical protein HRF87_22960 [Bacillus sp. CRN 9]|nr:hypothetical protein [Bacillus sp. CRN 9]
MSHAEDITFNGVTIKDIYAGHAMDLSGTRNVLIENCSFIGYRDRPDQSRNYAEAILNRYPNSGWISGIWRA